jgi:acyl carrier protein phosphodiesterase
MNPRTHIAARRFWARLQQRRAQQATIATLTDKVLARYAVELAEADARQLVHLAQRAEARYASDLGARMRALVDAEHARRGGEGGNVVEAVPAGGAR